MATTHPETEPELTDEQVTVLVERDWTSAMVPDARRMAPNFVVAGILPLIAYGLLRPHVSSDAVALGAVLVFPIAEIAYERRRMGRFEPIGIIALIGITAGIIGAVAFNGNDFLLKIRDSLVTGLFGVVCLATLPLPRPAMYFMGRAFAAGSDPAKIEEFELMGSYPGVMSRFRLVTLVWGLGLTGEAAGRVLLALTLTTGVFLVVAQIIGGAVIAGLIWWTITFSRRSQAGITATV